MHSPNLGTPNRMEGPELPPRGLTHGLVLAVSPGVLVVRWHDCDLEVGDGRDACVMWEQRSRNLKAQAVWQHKNLCA